MPFRTILSHLFMCADDVWLRHVWLNHTCDITQSYMRHDSVIRVTWLNDTCDMTQSYICHDAPHYHILLCAPMTPNFTSLTCDNPHSYVWHDSLMCVTWLTRHARWWHPTSPRECVWHDSIIHVTWLNHTCDMMHYFATSRYSCWWRSTSPR